MPPLLTAVVLTALAQAGPTLALDDSAGCVDATTLEVEVREALPQAWREADTLGLSVQIRVGAEGQPELLRYRLEVRGAPSAGLERQMAIVQADCASLGRLIAVVVGRHLAELPQEAWPDPPEALPPPTAPMPGGVTEATPPALEPSGITADLDLRFAFEVGLDAPLWGGGLGVDATLFADHGFALLVGADVLAFAPLSVGEGAAQLTDIVARVGPAWELPWGAFTLSVAAGLGLGVTLGQGMGFDENASTAALAVRAWARASMHTDWGLIVALGLTVAAVRPQLGVAGETAQGEVATGRLGLSVGYRFGD